MAVAFQPNQHLGTVVPFPQAAQPVGSVPRFGCGPSMGQDRTTFASRDLTTAWDNADENRSFLDKAALKAIHLYQRLTRTEGKDGQAKNRLFFIRCPFDPSCSEYTADAIREHGAIKGIALGFVRVFFKCNPIYVSYRRWKDTDWNAVKGEHGNNIFKWNLKPLTVRIPDLVPAKSQARFA